MQTLIYERNSRPVSRRILRGRKMEKRRWKTLHWGKLKCQQWLYQLPNLKYICISCAYIQLDEMRIYSNNYTRSVKIYYFCANVLRISWWKLNSGSEVKLLKSPLIWPFCRQHVLKGTVSRVAHTPLSASRSTHVVISRHYRYGFRRR